MGEFTIVEGGTIYKDDGCSYIIGYYFDNKKKEGFYVLYNRFTEKMIPGKRMENLYSQREIENINQFIREATKNVLHNFHLIHTWTKENFEFG